MTFIYVLNLLYVRYKVSSLWDTGNRFYVRVPFSSPPLPLLSVSSPNSELFTTILVKMNQWFHILTLNHVNSLSRPNQYDLATKYGLVIVQPECDFIHIFKKDSLPKRPRIHWDHKFSKLAPEVFHLMSISTILSVATICSSILAARHSRQLE